jgi:hypothetical protein
MKKVVLVLLVVFIAVSFFSCGKKVDFYDIRVLYFNDTAAYGRAYNKLNKQEKAEYHAFTQNMTDENLFNTIVAKQELFPNFNKAMGKFLEVETKFYNETENNVSKIQKRISDLQSAGIIQNSIRISEAFFDYFSVLHKYSDFSSKIEFQYDHFAKSISNELPEELAIEEQMTRIEIERLKYETKKYMFERYQILTLERTTLSDENDQLKDLAREEAERRRQEQIALANQRAEQNRIEKGRRGGVVRSFSINNLSSNEWTEFFIMKDGSGTFDHKFNVDAYVNSENILFGRQTGIVNEIMVINGKRYAIAFVF